MYTVLHSCVQVRCPVCKVCFILFGIHVLIVLHTVILLYGTSSPNWKICDYAGLCIKKKKWKFTDIFCLIYFFQLLLSVFSSTSFFFMREGRGGCKVNVLYSQLVWFFIFVEILRRSRLGWSHLVKKHVFIKKFFD